MSLWPFLLLLLPILILCTINPSFPSPSCICNVTTSCDYLCCCDSTCNPDLVTAWKQSNSCNPPNSNGLAINMCSNIKPAQMSDLYSGLRMIYEVIKRLFCIQTINFNASMAAYNTRVSAADAASLIDSYTKSLSTSSASNAGFSNPYYSSFLSFLYNNNKLELPSLSGNSYCQWNTSHIPQDFKLQPCKYRLGGADNFHLISTYKTKYPSTTSVFNEDGSQSSDSTVCSTAAVPWSCTSAVKEALFRVTISDDLTNVTNVEVELTVATFSNYQYPIKNINIGVTWVTSNTSYYQRASSIGYTHASPLVILYNSTMVNTPLRISFMDGLGNCVTTAGSTINIWDIKFGQDFSAHCRVSNNIKNIVLANVNQIFKGSLGAIGGANPAYSGDFVSVGGTALTKSGVLSIYYSRIGEAGNSQFMIKSATLSDINQANSNSEMFSFFVEFKEIPVKTYVYVPPPPTAQVKLDNDVLYPFHIYSST